MFLWVGIYLLALFKMVYSFNITMFLCPATIIGNWTTALTQKVVATIAAHQGKPVRRNNGLVES